MNNKIELTDRETALLRLLCQDKKTREIAIVLKISPRTVESDRDKLRKKLGKKTIAGLVVYAIFNGIYSKEMHFHTDTGDHLPHPTTGPGNKSGIKVVTRKEILV